MADEPPAPVPDAVPRSPTGRVPQWVLDEAAGRSVSPVPFRGGAITPGLRLPEPRVEARRSRTARLAAAVAVVSALGVAAVYLQGGSPEPTTAPTAASAPRVERPPDRPPPGLREQLEPLGTPPPAPAMREGDDYRFLRTAADRDPVTWSPCRPIRYATRPDHAPPGGAALVAEAVARIEQATGLVLQDAGRTDEAPAGDRDPYQPDRYGDRWAPVLIAWATPEEVPDLAAESVVAQAGPIRVTTPSGDETYVSGSVHLDPGGIAQVVRTAGPAAGRAVVLHELGHLVGLAHVANDAEVMAPEGTGVTELGRGDRAGLAALGRGPCRPDV